MAKGRATVASAPALARGARPAWTVLALAASTVGLLLPFAGKPVHMDDPLFLWAARQIARDPTDFYGVRVNWYGWKQPLAEVAQNPPLASYWAALAGTLAGWSEPVLHLAFCVPAVLAVLGTWRLARTLTARPALAALIVLATPAFLVASTTLMCDVVMLALFVWAILLWVEGLESGSRVRLAGSALLAGLAGLTKYFGIGAVPLLVVYTLARERRPTRTLCWLLVPVVLLAGYELWTLDRYGTGHLAQAAAYSLGSRTGQGNGAQIVVGLAFAGGTLLPALFFAPAVRSRGVFGVIATLGILCALVLPALAPENAVWRTSDGGASAGLRVQLGLFAAGGVSLLALALRELRSWRKTRDPTSALLGLWLLGTFAFAVLVNWTVNARSLLPMAPPLAILIARAVEARAPRPLAAALPVAGSLLVALAVALADLRLAESAREAASLVAQRYAHRPRGVWFEGHWGFQYYLEELGGKPLGYMGTSLEPGDIVVIPENNTNTRDLPSGSAEIAETIELPVLPFLATLARPLGASFYASVLGPLPFALGRVPPERYYVLRVTRAIPAPIAEPR